MDSKRVEEGFLHSLKVEVLLVNEYGLDKKWLRGIIATEILELVYYDWCNSRTTYLGI